MLLGIFVILQITTVSAHIPSYDPYGIQVQQSHYFRGDRYAFFCITINDLAWREKLCEGGEDLESITMKRDVANGVFAVIEKAAKNNNKEVCNELKTDFSEFTQIKMKGSYDGKTLLQVFEDDCRQNIRSVAIVYQTPKFVRTFDLFIIFLSSILAYIYLAFSLRSKNVSSSKAYGILLIFQIIISFIAVFVGVIIQLGTDGPPVPPMHDFMFFKQQYWLSLVITGFAVTILSFALTRLVLLLFKKETNPRDRRSLAIFYTLVFNPFFFPIGPIIGFMNLLYVKRIANKKP